MESNLDPATFHLVQAHKRDFQTSLADLGLNVPVWVPLTSHSPWRSDVPLDHAVQQAAKQLLRNWSWVERKTKLILPRMQDTVCRE